MNDNLSNLLSVIAVNDARWSVARLSNDSGFHVPSSKLVHFMLVVEGSAYLSIGGSSGQAAAVHLGTGDMLLSLGGASITIRQCPEAAQILDDYPEGLEMHSLPWVQIGKNEPKTLLVVGRFEIEPLRWGPIKRMVPDVVVNQSATGMPPDWAGVLGNVRTLQHVLTGDGSAALSRRLAEICAIQVIRMHHAANRAVPKQADASPMDPRIAQAVRLINSRPAANWTVLSLARTVGMSRSVFSDAFDTAIGEAPIRYLTRVRMTIAAQMLRNRTAPIIEIAHQVGYASDISLIRSFKKFFGVTPTEFRSHLTVNEQREIAQFPLVHPAFVFDESTVAAGGD